MARMTQAERNAANALAREKEEAERALQYPNALMTMLARASTEGMKLQVKQVSAEAFMYVVTYNDRWGDQVPKEFNTFPNWQSWDAMEELEMELNRRDEARTAEQRKAALRQSATSKLSKEELAALKEMFAPNDEENFR